MPGVIEPATSGRAKCRACGRTIAKGELRFGELLPNPYGEGEAKYWFHLACAAAKRPEPVVEVLEIGPAGDVVAVDERETLLGVARNGVAHPRLSRLARAERASSGRARCRHCRETIDKDTWRFALDMWEDGRFGAMGFIHAGCASAYFGDTNDLVWRASRLADGLDDAMRDALSAAVATGVERGAGGEAGEPS